MKKIITLSALICLFSPALLMGATPIYYFGDPVFTLGPEAQGLGGAAFSMKMPHDSIYLNPASAAFTKQYAVDGTYSTVANTLSASVVDSKSAAYGAGLGYQRRTITGSDLNRPETVGTLQENYQQFSLSVFGKLIQTLAIGVGGRYSMRSGTGDANEDAKTWNGDVGADFQPLPKLGIGAVYKNVLGDSHDVEMHMLAGGAHFEVLPSFTVTGSLEKYSPTSSDPQVTIPFQNKVAWALGGQYTGIMPGLSLRAAYRNSAPWNETLFMGGLGYGSDNFHLDYALGLSLSGDKFNTHTFGLGLDF